LRWTRTGSSYKCQTFFSDDEFIAKLEEIKKIEKKAIYFIDVPKNVKYKLNYYSIVKELKMKSNCTKLFSNF